MNLRAIAACVLHEVIIDNISLTKSLAKYSSKVNDPRDKALLQMLCYGVCRWYFKLKAISNFLLHTPLKQKDFHIEALILVGLYQLIDLDIPSFAAINETVEGAVYFKKTWAKGLINASLRKFQRDQNIISQKLSKNDLYSHPLWMINFIKKYYPLDFENILITNNQYPPLALRVNEKRIARDNYLQKLSQLNIKAKIITETKSGIIIEEPKKIEELPGFIEGEFSVQDGAAQFAAELLDLQPKLRVLDACAAPGGKTTHMLELEPSIECVAIDLEKDRINILKNNLQRLNLQATCIAADITNTKSWWDNKLFDRILLDVPCSASGVIRRHPDIKIRRNLEDIKKFAATQLTILKSAWNLLAEGGILVYCTCSIFPEENVEVLQKFLNEYPASEEKIHLNVGINYPIGIQILPGMHNMDGFYYARLRK